MQAGILRLGHPGREARNAGLGLGGADGSETGL